MAIWNLLKDDRGGQILLALIALAVVLVPLLNSLPADSALYLPTYTVTLLGKRNNFV